ncbi:AIM24 family protein [Gordonia amicalis]|uniref:AIM24 family protein n=1 Tax=Gordonia amicalis TaxID=89053 RepID=UPI00041DA534|nr:AIM24 family protein [Gordonia amicalis]
MDDVLTLSAGENRPLPSSAVTVSVRSVSPVNTSAILLTDAGRVRSDADLIFYNQPAGPGVGYRSAGAVDIVTVDTAALPRDITTVVVAASLDGSEPSTFATAGALTATLSGGGEELTFAPTGLTSEAAVVCLEIYRRNDTWKVRAVGQGYDAGLAGLVSAFGIEVEDDPAPPPEPGRPPRVTDPQPWPPAAQPQSPPAAAPPPVTPPPAPATTQPTGVPMHSDLFAPSHAEVSGQGIQKQGSKMCRIGLSGEVMARTGSMVAYQGDLNFEALGSGGLGRMMRQAMTGEGVPLMKVTGRGDLFLANAASDVHLIDLDGTDGLTINGANVLAFDSTLRYDIQRVQGAGAMSNAGLYNCVFTGRGRIAITTDGTPVVLNVDAATYADPQAAVAWSSSLRTSVKSNDSFNLGTLMGRSTGERFTLAFSGQGFVVVQPSELPPGGFIGGTGGGGAAGSGAGGMLGGILGR